MKKKSGASNAAPPIDPHTAHQRAYYRLLRHVALWLIAQPAGGVAVHAGQSGGEWIEKFAAASQMIEHARDWWDIACSVWYELREQHAGHGDCLCPACTEQQFPALKRFQEESTQ